MSPRRINKLVSSEPSKIHTPKTLWNRKFVLPVCALAIASGLIGIGVLAAARDPVTKTYGFKIVNAFPHDPKAYCQGLAFDDEGNLFEGTGQYGESVLRQVDVESGRILRQVSLNRRIFGEGITVLRDKIYQLTWKRRTVFVYDKATFKLVRTHKYSGEGWGLTHDGQHLIMSDGTSNLRFLDPNTFNVVKNMTVRSNGRLVPELNELEFIDGEIWANVWFKDYIARISPESGTVLAWVDLTGLYPARVRSERDAVLNGIAFDKKAKRLFVTGKRWPKLFEIELIERQK